MLTDKAVKAAKPQPGKRYRKLADQGGLYLFCTTDGTRSWRYDSSCARVSSCQRQRCNKMRLSHPSGILLERVLPPTPRALADIPVPQNTLH